MTPRTISESGPNHGLSSVRTSFGNNVFVSEENDAEDEDEVLVNEDGEPDKRSEEKSSDSGLVESEGNSEECIKVDDEDSVLIVNRSGKAPKFRERKESHV
jgi:hypothetical protein